MKGALSYIVIQQTTVPTLKVQAEPSHRATALLDSSGHVRICRRTRKARRMVPGKEGRQRGIAPVVGSPGHYRVLSLASPTGAPRSVIQHFGRADGPIETVTGWGLQWKASDESCPY